jgi:Fur family zinc uptake transcriptional regulator
MQTTHNLDRPMHNHARCVDNAVQAATELCRQQGLRFTPIRQRVLELVWASHAPMAAYDLLKTLRKEKANAEAPTIYRALDFLQQHGLVHKIETMNAFVGCDHPGHPHTGQFLICTECNQVREQESSELDIAISEYALINNFAINSHTIELIGLCGNCRA